MSVEQYDSPLRYMVGSHSREEVKHLVEVNAFDGNGKCACEHFRFRCEPLLREGAKPSEELRCHHINEAREHMLNNVISMIEERVPKREKRQRAEEGTG